MNMSSGTRHSSLYCFMVFISVLCIMINRYKTMLKVSSMIVCIINALYCYIFISLPKYRYCVAESWKCVSDMLKNSEVKTDSNIGVESGMYGILLKCTFLWNSDSQPSCVSRWQRERETYKDVSLLSCALKHSFVVNVIRPCVSLVWI